MSVTPRQYPPGPSGDAKAWRPRNGRDLLALAVEIALAVVSGCFIFLATATFDIWPLGWVALLPLLFAVELATTRRRVLCYGFLTGLVCNVGGFYWIASLLQRFANLPWVVGLIGLLLLAAYQGLVFLLFAGAVHGIRRNTADLFGEPLSMALVAPVAMVAFEIIMPFIFPWYLAINQAWNPIVIQVSELTGPVGVTALLVAVSGALYDVATERTKYRRWIPAAATATVVVAALIFGAVRMSQVDDERAEAPAVAIGVVQGNIAFNMKGVNRAELAARQLADLQAESTVLETGLHPAFDRNGEPLESKRAELLLWTESSYPYGVPRHIIDDQPVESAFRVRRGFSSPVIFGAITMGRDRNVEPYPYNSALMLSQEGKFVGRFDKIFLLMFGEYIPGLETFPFLRKLLPSAASHFARGKEIVTFPFEHEGHEYRLGPMICYEDILPDFGRKLSSHHPHLLINLTNDAWFGDTAEPWQHLALSVFRAVETRADLVRAVNTGVSAFVDANGRVYAKTYAMDPLIEDRGSCGGELTCPGGYVCAEGHCRPRGMEGLLAEATLLGGPDGAGRTFYAQYGDLFGYLCVFLCLFAWLALPRLRRLRR